MKKSSFTANEFITDLNNQMKPVNKFRNFINDKVFKEIEKEERINYHF